MLKKLGLSLMKISGVWLLFRCCFTNVSNRLTREIKDLLMVIRWPRQLKTISDIWLIYEPKLVTYFDYTN